MEKMTLIEAILPWFKAKARRQAKTRRWRKRLCWLLGHKRDFKGSTTPVWFDPAPPGADLRTVSYWECLWCRCVLPKTYSLE